MGLVAGALWADARQGRRERPYSLNTGATEDDASRRPGRFRRHSAYFAKPSQLSTGPSTRLWTEHGNFRTEREN